MKEKSDYKLDKFTEEELDELLDEKILIYY